MKTAEKTAESEITCANCKHYSGHSNQLCKRDGNWEKDCVTGLSKYNHVYCGYERSWGDGSSSGDEGDHCGNGVFFEEANTLQKIFRFLTRWTLWGG